MKQKEKISLANYHQQKPQTEFHPSQNTTPYAYQVDYPPVIQPIENQNYYQPIQKIRQKENYPPTISSQQSSCLCYNCLYCPNCLNCTNCPKCPNCYLADIDCDCLNYLRCCDNNCCICLECLKDCNCADFCICICNCFPAFLEICGAFCECCGGFLGICCEILGACLK